MATTTQRIQDMNQQLARASGIGWCGVSKKIHSLKNQINAAERPHLLSPADFPSSFTPAESQKAYKTWLAGLSKLPSADFYSDIALSYTEPSILWRYGVTSTNGGFHVEFTCREESGNAIFKSGDKTFTVPQTNCPPPPPALASTAIQKIERNIKETEDKISDDKKKMSEFQDAIRENLYAQYDRLLAPVRNEYRTYERVELSTNGTRLQAKSMMN